MEKFSCPKANFGPLHWQENSITYTMLITGLYLIWSEGHQELVNKIESRILTKHIIRRQTENLWIWSWRHRLVVKVLDYQLMGPRFKNHWVASRSTQPFIFLMSMKWVPGIPGDFVVKGKLFPHSDSVSFRQLITVDKKGPYFSSKFF